ISLPKARAILKASRRFGLYLSFSTELIVWRVTPTSAASLAWDHSLSARNTRNRVLMKAMSHLYYRRAGAWLPFKPRARQVCWRSASVQLARFQSNFSPKRAIFGVDLGRLA